MGVVMFGMFFFLTLFVQNILGYSPIKACLAFLPVTAALVLTDCLASCGPAADQRSWRAA